ncbi:MAG: hypothetical protein ACI8RD_002233 [Bacillariaceae sp.]|jgi:hypothetical protein
MKQGLFPPTNTNTTGLNLPTLLSTTTTSTTSTTSTTNCTSAASADDVDISMDDSHASAMSGMTTESHNTNNTSMLSLPSPPRTQRRKQQRNNTNMAVRSLTMNTHNNNNNNNNNNITVRNRLFEDDEDDDDATKHDNNNNNSSNSNSNSNNNHHISRHHGGRGKTPSILKPIDLNLDFAESEPTASAVGLSSAFDDGSTPPRLSRRTSTLTPHPPSRPLFTARKKRSAEQHDLYGKEWNCNNNNNNNIDDDAFSAMESPVDMYTSPRISSPSSPSHNSRTTTGPGGGNGNTPCNSNYSNKSHNSSTSSGRMSIHRGSPFLYGGKQRTNNNTPNMLQPHKSPSSFQTLDGRTVQSKNPFSPMIFDVSLTPTQKNHHHLHLSSRNNSPAVPPMLVNDSLSFPLSSLSGCGDDNDNDNNNGDDGCGNNNNNNNGSSSFGSGSGGTTGKGGGGGPRRGSHLVLRHKLQKRSSSPANSNGVGVGITGHTGIQHHHHLHQPIAAASAASASANNNNMGIGIGMGGLMPPPLPSKDITINKNIKDNNSNINNNNNNNNSTTRDPLEQRASLYTRDGYPEKKGRYSFTGSPIKEQVEPTSAAAASSSSYTYIAVAAAAQTNLTATGSSSVLSTTSSINTEMMSIKSKPSYEMNEEDDDVKEVVDTSACTEDDVTVTSTTQEDFCTNIHKIRRRCKDDDVVAAAAQGESSWKRNGMYIQTNNDSNNNNNNYYSNNNANSNDDNNNNNDDDWGYYNNNNNDRNNNNSKTYYYNKQKSNHQDDSISPTDVLNFPLFRASPSNTSDVPPAPSKPIRRPPSRRYTPIRKQTGPPPTPLPSVRNSRSFEEEDTAFLGRRNGNEDDNDDDSSDDDDNGDDRITNVAQRRRRRLRPKSGGMDYLNLSPGIGGAGGEQTVGPPPSRFYSDFDVIAELGSGSFGNVFQALSRLDGCMYAIKVAHRVARGESDKDRMLKEVYALAALSDQADTATFHIVRYHQAWMEEQRLYIQTELCTTTLQAEMEQVAPMQLPLPTRYKCMREILLALEFIHKNGMVHLDIKPENIFVSS